MGIQIWGAFGGFQKKTGALVGHWLKGQNVITAIPHPSQKPPTQAQLDQRAKFKLIVSWLSWINALVKTGFAEARKEKQSPMNAAVAYNYANAITGVSPNFTIDYAKAAYSKGRLSPAYNPSVSTSVADEITFDWSADFNTGFGAATDLATLVAYNPDKNRFVYLSAAAARSALTFTLDMPADFAGDLVYCYISFVSANGKMLSDSTYIGVVTML
jgi:hypothetical protein